MYLLNLSISIILSIMGLLTEPGWQEVNEPTIKIKITVPDNNLQIVSDSGLVFYSSRTTDSLITSQALIYGNYSLTENIELSDYMTQTGETDTLNVIAQYMVANSDGGQLIYFQKQLNTPTKKIMDIGIKHPIHIDGGITYFISYTRYHLEGKRMAILTLSAQETFLNPLIDARNRTWNSLVLY
jgi:hypothetical protein